MDELVQSFGFDLKIVDAESEHSKYGNMDLGIRVSVPERRYRHVDGRLSMALVALWRDISKVEGGDLRADAFFYRRTVWARLPVLDRNIGPFKEVGDSTSRNINGSLFRMVRYFMGTCYRVDGANLLVK